jgi:hypothetical protein
MKKTRSRKACDTVPLMGTQRVKMKGVLSWLGSLPVQEIFVLPWLLCSQPSTKNFVFLSIHFFNSFVPIAQQAGHSGQAAVLGRLSLIICLWF